VLGFAGHEIHEETLTGGIRLGEVDLVAANFRDSGPSHGDNWRHLAFCSSLN
jgi:hypothetical protein